MMNLHLYIFKRVVNGDVQAYEMLFHEYYGFLCSYAYGLTRVRHIAEEIVENFFVDLWNNRDKINITSSVRSYFISSVHNRCMNYLYREKPKFINVEDFSRLSGIDNDWLIAPETPTILINELENVLEEAIEKLPENCKEIFLLSRYQELSYEEISRKLNISVNTVKTQVKIALRKLREYLKDYLVVLLLFIFR